MTIRAKLYAAIVMTVIGPVVTVAVALNGMAALGARFDDVADRAARQALALDLKFAVTDMNGWQTAYGYDDGRSRQQFERSRAEVERTLALAERTLTDPREVASVRRLRTDLRGFLQLDDVAYAALRQGREDRVRRIFLGPEIARFQGMAATAGDLASYEARRAVESRQSFRDARRDARRALVAVGLGAAVLIVLLLVTAQDVARAALEHRERAPATTAGSSPPPGA